MSDRKREHPKCFVRDLMSGVPIKWLVIALLPVFLLSCSGNKSSSTVVVGNARFEFLTPSLVRMEYSPSGQFVNAHTAVIKKRKWSPVNVQSSKKNGWLTAVTGQLTLRYKLNSGRFDAKNLTVAWHDTTGSQSYSWHPGEKDSLNLGGLRYSLDNIHKGDLPKPQPGLLSRSGYAFINDSHTPVWTQPEKRTLSSKTDSSMEGWIKPRKQKNDQDWYLLIYGRDYPKALNEYAELSGYIPMIPRYTLGPWITDMNFEYFPNSYQSKQPVFKKYNEQHLKNEILRFRHNHIPLDILVMDFGWHNYGWQGGYDWSPLIPKPKQFLKWLHNHGIKVSLNDHPGYGGTDESILSYKDSHAPEVLKDLGRSMPPKPTFNQDISKGWKFATDPHDRGIRNHWFAGNYDDSHWRMIKIGPTWENQGYKNYKGVAWYRKSVTLPSQLPDSLYLWLGKVNNSFRVYVNGKMVSHSKVRWYRPLTYTNITSKVKAGQKNELAIRVVDKQVGGGITREPVSIKNARPPKPVHFDLSNKKQAEVFMNDLHKPLMQEGVNFWWIDGGTGAVSMPGLNKQMWTNRIYYDYTQKETGKRAFIFSRYGGWGSQRYPAFFTGDTYSQWPVLAYEVPFTTRGGNVLMPYITHDIGGFHGGKINFDLYARWVEFGTFSPILRLHSAHENPYDGNVRMPWTYGQKGMSLVKKYFTLRIRLIPYIYTYARLAYERSLPLLRPLYLEYPDLKDAYHHPHEYFFGKEMLVAPVVDSTGSRTIYLPPGKWINFFTGKKYKGDQTFTAKYAVDQIPVFVRDGSIIPEQPDMAYSNAQPLNKVILNIYGTQKGEFDLYEDDGVSLKYKKGKYAWTKMAYFTNKNGSHVVVIGPTTGSFDGQVQKRSYQLHLHSITKPDSVSVNGQPLKKWSWDSKGSVAVIKLPGQSIRNEITVDLK